MVSVKRSLLFFIVSFYICCFGSAAWAVPINLAEDGIALDAGETIEFEFDGFLSEGLFLETSITALTNAQLQYQETITVAAGPDLVIDEILSLGSSDSWLHEELFEFLPATSSSIVITNTGLATAVFDLFVFRDSLGGSGGGEEKCDDEDECEECEECDDFPIPVPAPGSYLMMLAVWAVYRLRSRKSLL